MSAQLDKSTPFCIFAALLVLQFPIITFGLETANVSASVQRSSINPARIGVYFESLCPDSRRFFLRQLVPASQDLGSLFEVKLVPFGKARVLNNNRMICQHGQRECEGNRRMACFLSKSSNQSQNIETLGCILDSPDEWRECIKKYVSELKDSLDAIETCSKNDEGYKMMQEAEKETGRIGYVPKLTLNGKYDQEIQDKLESSLKQTICSLYDSTPEPCKDVN